MTRPFSLCAAFLCAAQCLPSLAPAAPLDLTFFPPDLEESNICVPPPPGPGVRIDDALGDEELTDEDRIRFLRRDIRTYTSEDADRYADFIAALIARREAIDASFTAIDALFARIDVMLAAGQFDELTEAALVPSLFQRRDALEDLQELELAQFYRDGLGVAADQAIAQDLILTAAFGGNAAALLEIARLEQRGAFIEGWDAPLDLTVTLAVGGLLGALDQGVCARANRIASEYLKGEIVAVNPALALAWYRFSAGQGNAEAAWRVVEFHLNAAADVKDNEELRAYLERALSLGIALDGKSRDAILASGAMDAAALEARLGFNRPQDDHRSRDTIGGYLQLNVTNPPLEVPEEGLYLDYLREIVQMETAPGRVFHELAVELLVRNGRWAAEPEALTLLEEATRRGDERGQRRLANMLVRYRDDPAIIARVDTLLADATARFGSAAAMRDLDRLYRCQVNDAPRMDRAQPWASAYAATHQAAPPFSGADLLSLSPDRDPETIALVQSRALDRHARMMASHAQRVQADSIVGSNALRFWARSINRSRQALEEFAELEFDIASSPAERDLAVELLRRVMLHNGPTTALELGYHLVEYHGRDPGVVEEIVHHLTMAANRGEGAAIRMLSRLQADTIPEAEIFATFADAIEERGDFLALMFAVPHIAGEQLDDYIDRAVSLMNCGTKDAAELADAYTLRADGEMTFHWINIGLNFDGGHVLSKLAITNRQMRYFDEGAAPGPVAHTRRDLAEGDPSAILRLLQITANPDLPSYDPDAAIQHFLTAQARGADPVVLAGIYRSATQPLRDSVDAALDIAGVLAPAAEAGSAEAAAALGLLIRARATGSDALTEALGWLEQAAEGGHAQAMVETGRAYGFGLGAEEDLETALMWLMRASQQGHPQAEALAALLRARDGT